MEMRRSKCGNGSAKMQAPEMEEGKMEGWNEGAWNGDAIFQKWKKKMTWGNRSAEKITVLKWWNVEVRQWTDAARPFGAVSFTHLKYYAHAHKCRDWHVFLRNEIVALCENIFHFFLALLKNHHQKKHDGWKSGTTFWNKTRLTIIVWGKNLCRRCADGRNAHCVNIDLQW